MEMYGPSEREISDAKAWLSPPKTPPVPPKPLPFNAPKKSEDVNTNEAHIEDGKKTPPVPPKSLPCNAPKKFEWVNADEAHIEDGNEVECVSSQPIEKDTSSAGHRPLSAPHIDIHEWIKMKQFRIEHAMCKAEEWKIRKWKQRQETAKSYKCPGQRGAIVYKWDRDECQQPVRSRVNRANVDQAWNMFTDSQRWYNCVENEWELCQELDPNAIPHDDEEEYDDYLFEYDEQSNVTSAGWLTRDGAELESDERKLATNSFNQDDIETRDSRDLSEHVMDAFELITLQFGYAYVCGSKYETMTKPPIKLQKALRIIGDGFQTPVYGLAAGAEASFIQYVMYLDAVGHADVNISEVPSVLCDLYPDNPSFLGHRPSTVHIHEADYLGTILYVIRHVEEEKDKDWILAVKDPCTALRCIRSMPTSLTELVRDFINTKTPFYTLRPIPDTDKENEGRALPKVENFLGTRVGLGERSVGHILDLTDYVAYEAVRRKLVQNRRIARAVVKRGGVISRLSDNLVDEYAVLDGPVWDTGGKVVRVSIEIDGVKQEYFDDDMNLEELATYVGLYRLESE